MRILEENYRELKLDNGLFVALQQLPLKRVYADLRVHFGAYHETEEERGLAHFLEHCLSLADDEKDINGYKTRISNISEVHPATGTRYTLFDVALQRRYLDFQLDFLRSIFVPNFRREYFEAERRNVLKEIARRTTKHDEFENTAREAFLKGHPMSRRILGYKKVVEEASPEGLIDFHRRGYHPNNADLVLVGDFPSDIDNLLMRKFGDLQKGESTRVNFPSIGSLKNRQILYSQSSGLLHSDDSQSGASLLFLFHAPPRTSPEYTAFRLLHHIFASNNNCRLYKSITSKGYSSQIGSELGASSEGGTLTLRLECFSSAIEKVVDSVFRDLRSLREGYVERSELEEAKIKYESDVSGLLDDPTIRPELLQDKIDGFSLESELETALKVSPKNILEVGRKYLPSGIENANFVLNVMGPYAFENYSQLQEVTRKFRGELA